LEFPFTIQQKPPSSFRLETDVQGLKMVQATDGETAWQITPLSGGRARKLPAAQARALKSQADLNGPLTGLEEAGLAAELVEEQNLGGTPVYHLRLYPRTDTLKADTGASSVHVYVDAETFLERMIKIVTTLEGNPVEVETYLRNFKDVGGIKMAHSVETRIAGRTVSRMTIEKVKPNVDIDDTVFRMPQE
jgi:outer membrane lipoprotein-sorting protein